MKSWRHHNDNTMLSPVILIALVISYVICVLLLGGLQKEDLDANTLEKLERHNVNIYDMNNESLRQECLSKSNSDKKEDTKEHAIQKKYTLVNEQIYNENSNTVDNSKSKLTSSIRNFFNGVKTNDGDQNNNGVIEMIKEIENFNITNNVKQHQDREPNGKKQSSLDMVLNFWNKISHGARREESIVNRTAHLTRTGNEIASTTLRTQNSKDVEYFNRIIAEYLATQTATTMLSTTNKPNIDTIYEKFKDFLAQHSGENKKLEVQRPFATIHNPETNFNEKNDLSNLGIVIPINNNDYTTIKPLRIYSPQQVHDYYNNDNEQLEKLKDIEYFGNINILNREQIQKQEALQYLDDILRFSKHFNINVHIPYTEKNTKSERNQINMASQNSSIKNTSKSDSNGITRDRTETVSVDVINAIAEKVKEIVITDIRKETPITQLPTTSSITTSSVSTTNSDMKEKPTALQQKSEDKSEVRKTLMEILKEYNILNGTDEKMSIQHASSLYTIPPAVAIFNDLKANLANIEQGDMNPYIRSLLAVPWSSAEVAPHLNQHAMQTNFSPKNEYRLPPITIQTNSDQVPPLAIQISNPIKLTNAHISSTKKSENGKPLHLDYPNYEDITRKLSIADIENKIFRDSYKDRVKKLYDRIHYAHEHNKKTTNEIERPLDSQYQISLGRADEPNHYRLQYTGSNRDTISQKFNTFDHKNLVQATDLNHHESFKWPMNIEHLQYPNRPLDTENRESHVLPNYHDIISQLRNWQHPEKVIWPIDKNYETLIRALGLKNLETLNQPLDTKHHQLQSKQLYFNQHEADSRSRDFINHDVLNRLLDSHHRDTLSRLIKSIPEEVLNRPIDHYRGSHHLKEHIRKQQYPKTEKFHEKLEQTENLSPINYDSYINKVATETNYEDIASRQQLPLNKMKPQRTRFDDTHFRNFLKSQQKVTDMLENILAAKTKAEVTSVETS